ncbi:MAG: polyprenyl synthetase family protein [Planctomycetota bacterium]
MSAVVSNREELKQQIHRLLEEDLRAVHGILEQQFRNPNVFIRDVAQHVSRFQGKRIRPILTLLSARVVDPLFGAVNTARRLAAVVEMIHTATLVHDDVIDDSDLRRHVSTVHRRWNTETSVLFGDYLFSKAFHLAATTGDAEACRLIGRATDRTCEGELNQIATRLEQSASERDYFRVVQGKTGQLFAVSTHLGARASGADRHQQQQLRLFGARLGIAFQIADDVLDLTESTEKTGKDAANDLSNHRLTLPLLRALRLASGSDRHRLRELLFSSEAADHSRLREESAVRHGVESAQLTARRFADRAIRCLSGFPPSDARNALESIAAFSVQRSH